MLPTLCLPGVLTPVGFVVALLGVVLLVAAHRRPESLPERLAGRSGTVLAWAALAVGFGLGNGFTVAGTGFFDSPCECKCVRL